MNGSTLTLGLVAGLTVAGAVRRRDRGSRSEDDFDTDYWEEQTQELCEGLDYGLMQEGGDIARHFGRRGGRGYHDTSIERAEKIKKEGLGSHPGLTYHGGGGIEGHEPPFWICAWAQPDFAARMLAKGRRGRWRDEVSGEVAVSPSIRVTVSKSTPRNSLTSWA